MTVQARRASSVSSLVSLVLLLAAGASGAGAQALSAALACRQVDPPPQVLSPVLTIGGKRMALAWQRPGPLAATAPSAGINTLVMLDQGEGAAGAERCPDAAVIGALQRLPGRPASALQTTGLPPIEAHALKVDGATVTVLLTSVDDGHGRFPLAVIGELAQGAGLRIQLHLFKPSGTAATLAAIAALEDAYARLFQLPATAEFSVQVDQAGEVESRPTPEDGSQAAALAVIAGHRSRAVAQVQAQVSHLRFRPWIAAQLVRTAGQLTPDGFAGTRLMALRRELQPWAPDPHAVAVVVHTAGEIPAEAQVAFSRDPHHVCSARIDAERVAACRLEDQHGHDPAAHAGEGTSKTVVTFSGAVRKDVVFLPTTLVY